MKMDGVERVFVAITVVGFLGVFAGLALLTLMGL